MFAIWLILSAVIVKSVYTTTAEEKKKILHLHNNEREIVNPPAANMELMEIHYLQRYSPFLNPCEEIFAQIKYKAYSNEMEALANEWVSKCVFQHPDRNVYQKYRGSGQNLAVFGGKKPADIYESSVSRWNNEKFLYTYANNRCTGVCGHYTQVVWASTNSVGCAWKSCPGIMSGYKEGYLVACQYKLSGNMNGQKPYVSGSSCSQCAKADYCVKKQCSKQKGSGLRNNLAISSFSVFVLAYMLA